MADLKIGNNGGIARRSARVFEDDHDVSRKPEVYGAESGGHNNRRRDNTEQMIGKDKVDKITVTQTRRSSLSSTMTLSEDGLSAYNILTRENSRDELAMSQADLPKKAAKPKIPGRPRNFARVTSGIYRSGYPETEDHAFLKELGLKTIVTLVDKDYPEGYQTFMESAGIQHVLIKMEGTKKVDIPDHVMKTIMKVVLDKRNQPLLIHCNQGRHRTGCTVAAIRNHMGWYVEDILAEYTSYAEPKVREVDVKWINRFRSESFITIETAEHAADGVSTRTGHDMKKMVKMLFIAVLVIGVVGLVYLHENGIYSHA